MGSGGYDTILYSTRPSGPVVCAFLEHLRARWPLLLIDLREIDEAHASVDPQPGWIPSADQLGVHQAFVHVDRDSTMRDSWQWQISSPSDFGGESPVQVFYRVLKPFVQYCHLHTEHGYSEGLGNVEPYGAYLIFEHVYEYSVGTAEDPQVDDFSR